MAAKMKFGSSFSCVPTYHLSPFHGKPKLKLSSTLGLFDSQCNREYFVNNKAVNSCRLKHRLKHAKLTVKEVLSKRQCVLFATSGDQLSNSEFEVEDFELGKQHLPADGASSTISSYNHIDGAGGKPGFISFYGHSKKSEDEILVTIPPKQQDILLWFTGPTILVASFVFPSLYLRKILLTIFEDSLLTDFLILFFTEALFYCGVAVFLLVIDRMHRPNKPAISGAVNTDLTPHLGHRISSVAVLVLSIIIPTVTMGFVWPWTGPAASATLAPYLVGIVVQFAFEQYTKHINSPSWPAIPSIFQVYRLHQLNRAAQLVTALSFTLRGAEMTSHNLAIKGSLSTLLIVLQFLGIISIWSLSSFIMKYFPSISTSEL